MEGKNGTIDKTDKKEKRTDTEVCHMDHVKMFLQEEDGVGVVEIILILVVLIGLVIIFKEQLTELVQSILSKIAKQSNSI